MADQVNWKKWRETRLGLSEGSDLYVVTARVRLKGGKRDNISKPMSKQQATVFAKNLKNELMMSSQAGQWCYDVEVEPSGK